MLSSNKVHATGVLYWKTKNAAFSEEPDRNRVDAIQDLAAPSRAPRLVRDKECRGYEAAAVSNNVRDIIPSTALARSMIHWSIECTKRKEERYGT